MQLVPGRSPSRSSDDIILPLSLFSSCGSAFPYLALALRTISLERQERWPGSRKLTSSQWSNTKAMVIPVESQGRTLDDLARVTCPSLKPSPWLKSELLFVTPSLAVGLD